MDNEKKYLVVGAGFAGSVVARSLADRGKKVVVVDKREHIGGNAYDCYDSNGILIHPYGPHIFHTNSNNVLEFLSRFTTWKFYEHRVLAQVDNKLYPIPINLTTLNKLYNLNLTEREVEKYLDKIRIRKENIITSEDVVLNSVGLDLCNKFFKNYTKKQWGLELSELSAGVAARIPTRTNTDDRYFSDTYQFMPSHGYGEMFKNMLANDNISLYLNTDFELVKEKFSDYHIVYTGPIDEYYAYCFGKLPYRSIKFKHEFLPDINQLQSVGTVNYPNDYDFTRITEFKHLTGQLCKGTAIVKEYPQADGEPYYPIPRKVNNELYKKYQLLADKEIKVTFVGRLAEYKYYNMDQVVAAALKVANTL